MHPLMQLQKLPFKNCFPLALDVWLKYGSNKIGQEVGFVIWGRPQSNALITVGKWLLFLPPLGPFWPWSTVRNTLSTVTQSTCAHAHTHTHTHTHICRHRQRLETKVYCAGWHRSALVSSMVFSPNSLKSCWSASTKLVSWSSNGSQPALWQTLL